MAISSSAQLSNNNAIDSLKQISSSIPKDSKCVDSILSFVAILKAHPDVHIDEDVIKHRTSTRNLWLEYASFQDVEYSFIDFIPQLNTNIEGSTKTLSGTAMIANAFLNTVLACATGIQITIHLSLY